jgi:hypothetical protein
VTAPAPAVPWWVDSARTGSRLWWDDVFALLATWSMQHGSGLRLLMPKMTEAETVRALRSAWSRTNEFYRAPGPEVTGWLALYACAHDTAVARDLGNLLLAVPNARDRMRQWLAVGPLGPLAYAAGLSVEEAVAGTGAGTLTAQHLSTLLILGGWRFPPVPSPAAT